MTFLFIREEPKLDFRVDIIDCDNQAEVDACFVDYDAKLLLQYIKLRPFEIPTGFLARDGRDRIIGRAVLAFDHADSAFLVPQAGGIDSPWLWNVFVEPAYQSKGVGTLLINTCLQFLRENGYQYVCLDADTDNMWYVRNWGFKYSHSAFWDRQMRNIYWLKL